MDAVRRRPPLIGTPALAGDAFDRSPAVLV
jgi:hypothetical protein